MSERKKGKEGEEREEGGGAKCVRLVFGILSCKWKTIAVQTKLRQQL